MHRLLTIAITGVGLAITAPAWSAATLTFQQGAGGYAGTQDTELWGGSPGVPLGLTEQSVSIDGDNGGNVSQGLIRFDGIFGGGAGLIGAGQRIDSAKITLQIASEGSGLKVHDMLTDWAQASATWGSLSDGVRADGIEAAVAPIASFGQNDSGKHVFFPSLTIDVTDSLRKAQIGQLPGYGWAFIPFPSGTNGVDFSSSEAIGVANRPLLTVEVSAVPEPGSWILMVGGVTLLGLRLRRRADA